MYSQENDRKLFDELLRRLDVSYKNPQFELLFKRIMTIYTHPARCYHSFSHIRKSLFVLEKYKGEADDLSVVTLAIWFHDIDQGLNHEQKSAEAMKALLKPYLSFTKINKVERAAELILDTSHPSSPITNDGQLIHDIDLYGFSESYEQCLGSLEKIYREYPKVFKKDFLANYAVWLESLWSQGNIFKHHSFSHLEKRAKHNIKRLLEYCQY